MINICTTTTKSKAATDNDRNYANTECDYESPDRCKAHEQSWVSASSCRPSWTRLCTSEIHEWSWTLATGRESRFKLWAMWACGWIIILQVLGTHGILVQMLHSLGSDVAQNNLVKAARMSPWASSETIITAGAVGNSPQLP